jgi:NAD(P)-dependent dehydrogenase (short-subunit alcohol dehydrogenase family)
MQLNGKIALITGGTTGIGFETAKLFLHEGSKVFITGQDSSRLQLALQSLGGNSSGALVDVRDLNTLQNVKDQVFAKYGHIDVLFANAGVAFGTPLDATSPDRFDEMMDINVKGVFFTVKHFVDLMQPGSSIILNTSWLNQTGTAGLSLLSASKAAVRSLARTWSAELLSKGIRVNAVSPGAINTPIHAKTGMTPEQLQQFAASIVEKIPLRRFGDPKEIAKAALFLASDASSYMLGAEIVVDGGFSQL